jgi:transposase
MIRKFKTNPNQNRLDGLSRYPNTTRGSARLHAFAKHWGFRPHACAPYRARTKGKDERGVGYVKKNAIAGRRFVEAGWRRQRFFRVRLRIDRCSPQNGGLDQLLVL